MVFVIVIKKSSSGEVGLYTFSYLGTSASVFCLLTIIKITMLQTAAGNIINMLWQLMENSLEELKLLQTVLVLLTTNTVVHDEALSKVGKLFARVHMCFETVFE